MQNVELRTDGSWMNTKLMVDGVQEAFVTCIEIIIGNKARARITVEKSVRGTIPYSLLADIKGRRYKSNSDGSLLTMNREPVSESFQYRHVNIIKI